MNNEGLGKGMYNPQPGVPHSEVMRPAFPLSGDASRSFLPPSFNSTPDASRATELQPSPDARAYTHSRPLETSPSGNRSENTSAIAASAAASISNEGNPQQRPVERQRTSSEYRPPLPTWNQQPQQQQGEKTQREATDAADKYGVVKGIEARATSEAGPQQERSEEASRWQEQPATQHQGRDTSKEGRGAVHEGVATSEPQPARLAEQKAERDMTKVASRAGAEHTTEARERTSSPSQEHREAGDRAPEQPPSVHLEEEFREPTFAERQEARRLVPDSGLVPPVPLIRIEELDQFTGAQVFILMGSDLPSGSLKIYSAVYELSKLPAGSHVVVASSGNHGRAFAEVGHALGMRVTVIVPESIPRVKEDAIRAAGGEVIKHGPTYDEAHVYSQQYAREHGAKLFDVASPGGVAGLGVPIAEALDKLGKVNAILVPGGGGTIVAAAGLAAEDRTRQFGGHTSVIAAVSERVSTIADSFKAGHVVKSPPGATLADAVRVEQTEPHLLQGIRERVTAVAQVSERNLKRTVGLMSDLLGYKIEGAGALALAALLSRGAQIAPGIDLRKKRILVVVTGGNIDAPKLEALNREYRVAHKELAQTYKAYDLVQVELDAVRRELSSIDARLPFTSKGFDNVLSRLAEAQKVLRQANPWTLTQTNRLLPRDLFQAERDLNLLKRGVPIKADMFADRKHPLSESQLQVILSDWDKAQAKLASVGSELQKIIAMSNEKGFRGLYYVKTVWKADVTKVSLNLMENSPH